MADRQTRRHLTLREVELALARGKDVEILLGFCGTKERRGVRFAVLSNIESSVRLSVFEMLDARDPNFLDLYEMFPLDDEGDPDGLVLEKEAESVDACLGILRARYPNQNYRMVNFGVLADEYLDLISGRDLGLPDG